MSTDKLVCPFQTCEKNMGVTVGFAATSIKVNKGKLKVKDNRGRQKGRS